jgi:hypoxanthine phosphoribosyltransferase
MSPPDLVRPSTVLFTAPEIQIRVAEMANEIRRDAPDDLHLIAVLKGAFVFLSDLVRSIEGHVSIDFLATTSYADRRTSSGDVRLLKDIDMPLAGRNVVIVEDVVDTGLTLAYLCEALRSRSPRTLRTACLLNKPSRRKVDVQLDYVGFTIADCFVVGYGLDCGEQYRNLPHIAMTAVEIV